MQLSSYDRLTPENIIFNEAKEFKVKDSKIKYKRIPIEIKYPNGKKGALVIETPFLFSFGVSEKKNQENNKLVGYSIPVCLWGKDSEPNTEEKAFFDTLNNIGKYAANILKLNTDLIWHQVYLPHFITNRLNILIKKERRKHEKMSQLLRFFTQNLFTLRSQRKYFLYSRPRRRKI